MKDLFPIFTCRPSPVMRNKLIQSEEQGRNLNKKRKKKLEKFSDFIYKALKKLTQIHNYRKYESVPVIMLSSMVPKTNE